MRFLIIILINLTLFGAKLSVESGNQLKIAGTLFKDRCALITINTKVVGTKDDYNGSDEIVFKIYNDGKVIQTSTATVPLLQAKELNLTIVIENFSDAKSPGIAIECEELGIYVDPFYLQKSDESCSELLNKKRVDKELQNICPKLRYFGISCN